MDSIEEYFPMLGFNKKTVLPLLAVLLAAVLLSGCSSYRDITVGTCRLESISPKGLKAVDAGISAEVDNPANEITISGISGTVYYEDDEIGFFEAPEVTVPGRTSSKVDILIRATLSDSLSLMQIMSMASGFKTERLTLDISMTVKVKGGLKRKIELKGLPVDNFIGKVSYESV